MWREGGRAGGRSEGWICTRLHEFELKSCCHKSGGRRRRRRDRSGGKRTARDGSFQLVLIKCNLMTEARLAVDSLGKNLETSRRNGTPEESAEWRGRGRGEIHPLPHQYHLNNILVLLYCFRGGREMLRAPGGSRRIPESRARHAIDGAQSRPGESIRRQAGLKESVNVAGNPIEASC